MTTGFSTEGDKTYTSITELPLISDIQDGDKFIIQASTGTSLLNFSNFFITLSNTSFGSQFNEMYESYSASSAQLEKIGASNIYVNNLSSDKNNLTDAVNQLNNNDIANYNEISAKINTIIDLINNNPTSFPILNSLIPIDKLPFKS